MEAETCARLSVVNFAMSYEGIKDLLMTQVVTIEQPEKAISIKRNMEEIFSLKKKKYISETALLKMLQKTQGDILADEELVHFLQRSQEEATTIQDKMRKVQSDHANIEHFKKEIA